MHSVFVIVLTLEKGAGGGTGNQNAADEQWVDGNWLFYCVSMNSNVHSRGMMVESCDTAAGGLTPLLTMPQIGRGHHHNPSP